jgi:hypothetical protein
MATTDEYPKPLKRFYALCNWVFKMIEQRYSRFDLAALI